jgi:hypothetical protein
LQIRRPISPRHLLLAPAAPAPEKKHIRGLPRSALRLRVRQFSAVRTVSSEAVSVKHRQFPRRKRFGESRMSPTRCTRRIRADQRPIPHDILRSGCGRPAESSFMLAYTKRKDDDDFGQPGTIVRKVMDSAQGDRLVSNVAAHKRSDRARTGARDRVLAEHRPSGRRPCRQWCARRPDGRGIGRLLLCQPADRSGAQTVCKDAPDQRPRRSIWFAQHGHLYELVTASEGEKSYRLDQ